MKRILVAEDDPDISDLLEARLLAAGYEVIKASDGVEAFVKASNENPDMIILDVCMPNLSGLEFVHATRSMEMKEVPILVLTALSNTEQAFHDHGVEHFLTKPFDPQKLLERVASIIPA